MKQPDRDLSRRALVTGIGTLGRASIGRSHAFAASGGRLSKPIPATSEQLPVIDMGSWITFDVGDDADALVEDQHADGAGDESDRNELSSPSRHEHLLLTD